MTFQTVFPQIVFWMGIQDPTNSGNKDNWKDVYTGKSIGHADVPRRDYFLYLQSEVRLGNQRHFPDLTESLNYIL